MLHAPERPCQKLFKDKPGRHPKRGVVQTDDAVDICTGTAVVPGAHLVFFQNAAADIFPKENKAGVEKSPQKGWEIFDPAAEGL